MRTLRLAGWLVLLLWGAAASAHLTPNSEVNIDFGQHEAVADIIIPLGEYSFATGNPGSNTRAGIAAAKSFLNDHVRVSSADGERWQMMTQSIEFARIAGPPDLHAIVRLIPPTGHSARRLAIDWTAVIDTVPNHFVLFVARSDFAAGKVDDRREVLGALQGGRRHLVIDRGAADPMRGFRAALALGMRHIAEGHDHLLFLIALLLPAPMLASGGVWRLRRRPLATVGQLARIVTAFTIGHSLTLIGAAFLGWQLPARPVEIGIALSILVSAIHAWRPIFPGREPLVAAGFGLVHGLAFATVVGRFGLGMEEKAASILGFNLGIELVQLLVVLAVVPSLLLLSRTRLYTSFRSLGAGFAGLAAIAWIIERVAGTPNPVAGTIDAALSQAPWLIAGLTLLGLAAFMSQRRGWNGYGK